MVTLSTLDYSLLILAAFMGGAVDAIAGGGGLICLPTLLSVGLPPHLALGTNKAQSMFGAAASLYRYARAGIVNGRRARWAFPLGLLGAPIGASAVLLIKPETLRPLVVVLLLVAAFVVMLRPKAQSLAGFQPGRGAAFWAALLAFGIAAYDGFFGPGTGTFLIVALSSVLALPLVQASAEAKVVNLASNFAATALFSWRGVVLWKVALPMAAAQLIGGALGAHWTVAGGDKLVRRVLLCVVAALIAKLTYDLTRLS